MKQLLVLLMFSTSVFAQFPSDSILEGNQTPTYEELIDFYQQLSGENEGITLYRMGESDYGVPIYLCILNAKGDSSRQFEVARKSTTVLINNGIHPGEPCGINASMQVALDYSKMSQAARDDYPVVAIVPAYNVGGMYNRGAYSRANQKGPQYHGFRGNAQHLDLNRDFIKMDSENMFTFARIFHGLDPDIFIDTHTSNGADYQYTLTYITPIYEKLAPSIRQIYQEEIVPHLSKRITDEWNYEPVPYIYLKGKTLDEGLQKFNASPRYSMGYADLFNTISFTTETHMLKPFQDRVQSTYAFLLEMLAFSAENAEAIEQARSEAIQYDKKQSSFPTNFVLDSIRDSLAFKGYEWKHKSSSFGDDERLYYDRDQPFERFIPWYHHMRPTDTLTAPYAFIIERQEKDVQECLAINEIALDTLQSDTVLNVAIDYLEEWKNASQPYEGHFLHRNMAKRTIHASKSFKKGDVIVYVTPKNKRFLVHVLSPEFRDSYFAWNFFDSYLQQKEHFSPYVFEELAVEYLNQNDTLRERFETKVANDEDFALNRRAQLQYIYENSPYHEREHLRIPVFRILPD